MLILKDHSVDRPPITSFITNSMTRSSDLTASVHLPIPGMDSVIVTVSGYHGLERFKLIKLISHAGGSYVGSMNQSTTHLICWKFNGRKYELAKKFKTMIVNHRWIEDCIKQGRRVSEHSYAFSCGKEMGTLLMDIPPIPDKVSNSPSNQSSAGNAFEKSVINIDREEDNAMWGDSIMLKESLVPEMERRKKGSKLKRRLVDKTTRQIHSSRATRHFDRLPLSFYYTEEPEELNPSMRRLRQKKSSCSIEPLRRGRRLVQKNIISYVLGSESEEECYPVHVHHLQDDTTDSFNKSSAHEGASTSLLKASDQSATSRSSNEAEPVIGLAKSIDLPDGASTLLLNASPDQSATPKDSNEADPVTRLNKSTDLSCVICWTDFSSTRGVLPCGHRFCFPCIQNWADHMSSSRKISTCPLCKASFDSITKVDDAVSSDQKIYSQTIPHDPSVNIYVLPICETSTLRNPLSAAPVCSQCCCREPEDLLIRCHLCQIRCVHSYCLDPYMLPWTCTHCKDLRMLYHYIH